ncbi:hypothetical protein Tco_0793356 [Tanacetum coccineum]
MSKPPVSYYYRKVEKGETSSSQAANDNKNKVDQPKVNAVILNNSFGALTDDDANMWDDPSTWPNVKQALNVIHESDDEEVDQEIIMETPPELQGGAKNINNAQQGASTPPIDVPHTSNGAWCTKGSHIILGWNTNDVDVVVISQDDQVMHTRIWFRRDRKEVFCSFIYAHNHYTQRRKLWANLSLHKAFVWDRSWCLMGDFNAALFLDDSSMGRSSIDISMREFRECVEEIEVMDVNNTGLKFTWNQKPKGKEGLLKKIDRVLANISFVDAYVGAYAIFQPYRISDHSLAVLKIPMVNKMKPRTFKFANILVNHTGFKRLVQENWSSNVSGFRMFQVVSKLKNPKRPFQKLLFDHGNLHSNVKKEAVYVQAYNDALILKERFLKQKAKIEWLQVGDTNFAYFHKSVKSKVSRSHIDYITTADGTIFEGDRVPSAFVDHYTTFLGQQGNVDALNIHDLFGTKLDENVAAEMVKPITPQEVKEAIFSMGNDKSPGPDGYTTAFFKEAWDIISNNVILAAQEFFINGKLLKQLNHTIIALIPKVKSPVRVNDYRPISCCNILFKCISKIISNRIKVSLQHLISTNQSAFVPGRNIADNILLTQELMHNYHLDRGSPRCSFKVDIQKAYDTVDWRFLKEVLVHFGFHQRMIDWIMECVTTTSFSININGILHGYFKGRRGLRQGDPLSPYLFTLVMEVLTLMLQRRVRENDLFTFHRYCSKLNIINLCFADDLFLFAHGDVNSANVIMGVLNEFKGVSGLVPSLPKSTAYFCNVLNHVKIAILQIIPFEEGTLPVKYLGVPLITSRLVYRDCQELIERVQNRITDWKNKSLSATGRLQLIRSVISSLHVY